MVAETKRRKLHDKNCNKLGARMVVIFKSSIIPSSVFYPLSFLPSLPLLLPFIFALT